MRPAVVDDPAVVWKRGPDGVHAGLLNGRKVARIKRLECGRWGFWYRSATMVLTKSGEPCGTLRSAKAAVLEALTGLGQRSI